MKNVSLYTGLAIFLVATIPIFFPDFFSPLPITTKWAFIIIVTVLYCLNEYFKNLEITKNANKKIIKALLARVESLKQFNRGQRLRSNIFCKVNGGYKLIHHYNMDNNNDREITIPENMGVTGEVFRTGIQEIGNRDELASKYRTPPDIIAKAPSDLQWICSTPIKDKNDRVIYTLSIDGNIDCVNDFDDIKTHASQLAEDLKLPLGLRS